ncbi:type III secretion system needle filament subunit SctF [Citrobacter sp. U14242]|uniref:type III secretion system needle filament subunit SctF n=1 Tax=Citrobacter sp. U14242 TaxID=3390192 RepID=UPI00397B269E
MVDFTNMTHAASSVNDLAFGEGYISNMALGFESGTADLKKNLDDALNTLQNDPSNPANLAKYQSALSEYTLYRNAQSNVVKSFRDIDQSIIANFK